MFSNIDLEIAYMDFFFFSFKKSKDKNKRSKNHRLTWLQENYIKYKNDICKSLFWLSILKSNNKLIYRKIDKIELSKMRWINKKNIPSTPNTTPRELVYAQFDDLSGWNRLNLVDKIDNQSPGNSSNSTLNSSIGDRLSNLHSASPNLSSEKACSVGEII